MPTGSIVLTVTQTNVTAFNTASPATIPHLSNTATWRFKWRSGVEFAVSSTGKKSRNNTIGDHTDVDQLRRNWSQDLPANPAP